MKKNSLKINQPLIFCCLIVSMIFIRDVFSVEINKYVFIVIISIFMIFSKKESFMKILFFIIPLLSGLPGNYIIPISLIVYLLKTRKLNKYQVFFSFLVVLNELISYISFDVIYSDFGEIIAGFSYIPLFFLLLYDDNTNKKECIQYFLIGVTSLCIIILITNLSLASGNIIDLFANGKYRIGDKIIEEENSGLRLRLNANTLAYFCITSICFCLSILKIKDKVNVIFLILLMILFSICGIFTLSRTYIICYIVAIALYLAFGMRNAKTIIKSLFVFFIVILSLLYFINHNTFLKQGIISRFQLENVTTAGDRTIILYNYANKFFSSPKTMVFGTGSTKIRDKLEIPYSVHNGFFQVIICYGIPGALLFFFGIFKSLRVKNKKQETLKTNWIPLIITILFIQTIQFINPYMLLFPYVISKYIIVDIINDI